MRSPALGMILLLLAAVPTRADSWLPPGPELANAEDGAWYVLLQPTRGRSEAAFQLVKRAPGKPPRAQPKSYDRLMEDPPKLAPEAGDAVVAKGTCKVPLRVKCLAGGKGFVLFDTYGRVGYGTVLEVRDGNGKERWARTLRQLFSEEIVKQFSRSVSSIWWFEAMWVDEQVQDVVLVWRTKTGTPQVLRVALKDGAKREGAITDLLTRIGRGRAGEQITALDLARKLSLAGLLPAVQMAFADARTPMLARAHYAVHLHAEGDPTGKPLLLAAAQAGQPQDVRAYAVKHLPGVFGREALPTMQAAMRSEDSDVWRAAEEGLRSMGRAAVPTLIEMVADESASERYRRGAATALWNMDVVYTLPAQAALARASKSKLKRLAYAAGHALEQIRTYLAERANKPDK